MKQGYMVAAAIGVVLAQLGCATRDASYHYAQKQIEVGDLRFHETLRVDEYLNAFPQDWLKVEEGRDIVARVDTFSAAGGGAADRSILQVAVKTRMATAKEARDPLALALVIDVSGSMTADNKIEDTRSALVQAIRELKDGDYVALTTFSSGAETRVPAVQVGPRSRERLIEDVGRLTAVGGTNIEAGLVEGYRQMAFFPAGMTKRLLLLTDGRSNVGTVAPEEIARKAQVQYLEGARISTIGLGLDVDERMLRTIANRGNGHYYFAENGKALTKILREDLQTTVIPVAKDVSLRLKLGSGYVFDRIYGAEGVDARGQSEAQIGLGELNVNDWRILIAEVRGTGAVREPTLNLSGSYVSASDGSAGRLTATLHGGAAVADAQLSNVNLAVFRNAVLYGNALALIEASRLHKIGRTAAAIQILRTQINNNEVLVSLDDTPMIRKERENLATVLAMLERQARADPSSPPRPSATAVVARNRDSSPTKDLIREGLRLAAGTLPGLWSAVAQLLTVALE